MYGFTIKCTPVPFGVLLKQGFKRLYYFFEFRCLFCQVCLYVHFCSTYFEVILFFDRFRRITYTAKTRVCKKYTYLEF